MTIGRRAFVLSGAAFLLSACSTGGPVLEGTTSPAQLSTGAILAAINGTRARNGVKALTYSSRLAQAARTHANLMAARDSLSHTLGGSLRERVTAAGYDGAVGENLAGGQKTLEGAISGWLASPGHRSTLLSSRFKEFGLAAAVSARGKVYWAFIAGGDFSAWQ